jgi:hypothetical protein
MEDDGRCPNCDEDELEAGPGSRCYYCGWPDDMGDGDAEQEGDGMSDLSKMSVEAKLSVTPSPDEREQLEREGKARLFVRMEPQPAHRFGRVYDYSCERGMIRGNMRAINKLNPLAPVGSRHWSRYEFGTARVCGKCNNVGAVGIGRDWRCVTVTALHPPEQRDGVWGWVVEVERSK